MDAAPPPSAPEEPPARDWSLLPLDALASVFVRVGPVNVLMGAGLVCRSWLQAAKLPDVWRVVRFHDYLDHPHFNDVRQACLHNSSIAAMLKAAVDRSDGQLRLLDLVDGHGYEFLTDELMRYILERSPSLTTLGLLSCVDVFSKRLLGAIRESPLLKLRYLEIDDDISLTMEKLTAVLENCPALKVLRVIYCSIDEDEVHELPAKFPGIKAITIESEEFYYSFSSGREEFYYSSSDESDD